MPKDKFNIREVTWTDAAAHLINVRHEVFIVEQKVPREEEWDGLDETAWHWLATSLTSTPIGTARLLPGGQIGRMAVLAPYRKLGVGAALLECAVEKARQMEFNEVFLHAQIQARGFYESCGFIAVGDEFMEADIPHVCMTRITQAAAPTG